MSWENPRKSKHENRLEELRDMGFTKESLTQLYCNQKKSILDIEKIFPKVDAHYWMVHWNIPRRSSGEASSLSIWKKLKTQGITKELITSMYLKDKMSYRKINEVLGITTTQYYLKQAGIKSRTKSETNSMREFSEKTKKKISKAHKLNWENGNVTSRDIKPTYSEKQFLDILNELYPEKFSFVGNLALIIGGINPDFWDEGKMVIELVGTGSLKNPKRRPYVRKSIFESYGYNCLLVRRRELSNIDELKIKIINWIDNS